MHSLKVVAGAGRVVVASLHQPSRCADVTAGPSPARLLQPCMPGQHQPLPVCMHSAAPAAKRTRAGRACRRPLPLCSGTCAWLAARFRASLQPLENLPRAAPHPPPPSTPPRPCRDVFSSLDQVVLMGHGRMLYMGPPGNGEPGAASLGAASSHACAAPSAGAVRVLTLRPTYAPQLATAARQAGRSATALLPSPLVPTQARSLSALP